METTLLIADEVAEWLRVDKQRIYELVRTKQIPFIKLGERQYRFETVAIKKWLSAGGSNQAGDQADRSSYAQP